MTTQATQEINYHCNYSKRLFTIAIDIGGTLAKVVYSPLDSNKLMFHTIETERINKFIKFLHSIIFKYNDNNYNTTQIIATGGGAFKFYDLLKAEFKNLNDNICQYDEMECLIKGLDFFIHQIDDEVFTYNDQDGINIISNIDIDGNNNNNNESTKNKTNNIQYNNTTTNDISHENLQDKIYPYMLVNIGSGVSILKVTEPNIFTRVGGSSLGGGTLWGLLSLITGAKTYDQMLAWAQEGDNSQVDMLVGDIYGTDYNKIGLKSSSIASSFGKVFQNRKKSTNKNAKENINSIGSETNAIINNNTENTLSNFSTNHYIPSGLNEDSLCSTDDEKVEDSTSSTDIQRRNKKFKNQDISKSLLYAISNNIGQIAYLQAKVHDVKNIYFGGSYIRGHLTTMNTLSYAINFWSEGSKKAFFLKHEGYLGAMGAFLKCLDTAE